MLMILDKCRGNYRAELMYNERYSNHSRKSYIIFCRLKNRLIVSDPKDIDRIVNEEKSADVIAYDISLVTVNPHASSRLIAESGTSQISVIRILHNYKFHFYHVSFYLFILYGNDFANRVNFYNYMRQQFDLNPPFIYYLMFSDNKSVYKC